jgi:hypothetical protein
MTGAWMDYWSFFIQGATAVNNNYYNAQTSTWFGGAADPWTMANAGFGIQFNQDGHFIWTAAERSPGAGCDSYSAEYMTGVAAISTTAVVFDLDFWRSKFINLCDETQNVDTNVTPFEVSLPYQIREKQKPSGENYWELKFTNRDGSTFSYYRKS